METQPSKTMNRSEAIQYTNLPRRAFNRLLSQKYLTNFGTHTRWRFSKAQLDKLLENGFEGGAK
jgi:hypothetical protein